MKQNKEKYIYKNSPEIRAYWTECQRKHRAQKSLNKDNYCKLTEEEIILSDILHQQNKIMKKHIITKTTSKTKNQEVKKSNRAVEAVLLMDALMKILDDNKEHRFAEFKKLTSVSTCTLIKYLKVLEVTGKIEKRSIYRESSCIIITYYKKSLH
jgi:hypothetical protein